MYNPSPETWGGNYILVYLDKVFMADKIILRNVYGKMKEIHIQPGRQQNGNRWPFVKPVRYDSMGNAEMILSQDELNDPGREFFLPEDMDIVLVDGKTFDLTNPLEKNIWTSIQYSDLIAPTRGARDKNGNLYIDGGKLRYGTAEFYVDIPGEESAKIVKKRQKITEAWMLIGQDSESGRLTKTKLLGKIMVNAPATDVTKFLYDRATDNPDEVIELYKGSDAGLKLLQIDAKDKAIIIKKDGMYMYGETILGATDSAVLLFFKDPQNQRILQLIKDETYPEYASRLTPANQVVETPAAAPTVKKTTSKK